MTSEVNANEVALNGQIGETAGTLAETRRQIEGLKELVENLKNHLEQVPEYVQYLEMQGKLAEARHTEAAVKADLGELMKQRYQFDGTKEFPGIGKVAIYTVYNYRDVDALAWCIDKREHGALKVDRKAFDKVAEVLRPEFVEVIEDPRARIDGEIKA